MVQDPELQAMSIIADALEPIDGDARRRVIEWVAKRYAVALPGEGADTQTAGQPAPDVRPREYVKLFAT